MCFIIYLYLFNRLRTVFTVIQCPTLCIDGACWFLAAVPRSTSRSAHVPPGRSSEGAGSGACAMQCYAHCYAETGCRLVRHDLSRSWFSLLALGHSISPKATHHSTPSPQRPRDWSTLLQSQVSVARTVQLRFPLPGGEQKAGRRFQQSEVMWCLGVYSVASAYFSKPLPPGFDPIRKCRSRAAEEGHLSKNRSTADIAHHLHVTGCLTTA